MVDFGENHLAWAKNRLVLAQRLLAKGSHYWAEQVLDEVLEKFEKGDIRKKTRKYVRTLILQIWTTHARKLYRRGKDWIAICDAYQHVFFLLYQYKLFDQIAQSLITLIQDLLAVEGAQPENLALLLETASRMLEQAEKLPEALEVQLAVMLIRKFARPSETLTNLLLFLENILLRLRQDQRNLLVYVLLDNAIDFYQVAFDDKPEFIQELVGIAKNVVGVSIKDAFLSSSKILKEVTTRPEDFVARTATVIRKLEALNEFGWAFRVVENLLQYLVHAGQHDVARDHGRQFVAFAIRRGHFDIAFRGYDALGEVLRQQGDMEARLRLWLDAAREFSRNIPNPNLFNQAIQAFETALRKHAPQLALRRRLRYFDEMWQLKARASRASEDEFFAMVLCRAVLEEGALEVANLALTALSPNFKTKYAVEVTVEELAGVLTKKEREQPVYSPFLILRLTRDSRISLYRYSTTYQRFQTASLDQAWDDSVLRGLYARLLTRPGGKKGNETLAEGEGQSPTREWSFKHLGRCLYIMLPRAVRAVLSQTRVDPSKQPPNALFLVDEGSVPFDFIHDDTNFIILKYATGTRLGELPLLGAPFSELETLKDRLASHPLNFLFLGNFNATRPKIWDESAQGERILYPFPEGERAINALIEEFSDIPAVGEINYLLGTQASREAILGALRQGPPHVIHLASYLFFVRENPRESYFLTSGNEILSVCDLARAIQEGRRAGAAASENGGELRSDQEVSAEGEGVKPVVVNNCRIVDASGKLLENCTREAFLIAKALVECDQGRDNCVVVSRVAELHDGEDTQLLSTFYRALFEGHPVGLALLRARQTHFTDVALEGAEHFMSRSEEGQAVAIAQQGDILGASYILYGLPWERL